MVFCSALWAAMISLKCIDGLQLNNIRILHPQWRILLFSCRMLESLYYFCGVEIVHAKIKQRAIRLRDVFLPKLMR
jgi:hypothetical protein